MTRLSKACLGAVGLLTLVLVIGSAVAGARALHLARVVPARARLGLVRVALRPGETGVSSARALAAAPAGCLEGCAVVPGPQVAAAIAVLTAGESKKGGASSPDGKTPVAAAAPEPPPVEAEAPPVEAELPLVTPEAPAGEAEAPPEEAEAPAGETELPAGETELPAGETEPPPEEAKAPPEEAEPPAESSESSTDPGCPIEGSQATAPIAMSVLGCGLVASDTSAEANPIPFWGSIQCAEESRYSHEESGGDTHVAANGEAPDSAYRRLTVFDGDDFYGERCELGENDHYSGPTVFYHQGQQRITYYSERLPANFPLSTANWQTVMQMKQTQPSDDDCCGPQLEMEARQNRWVVVDSWNNLWEFPARRNVWTRFAWDVYYSQNPSEGWLQVSADLNDDGDFNDPGERSPILHAATLRTEPEGPNGSSDGLAAGDPIPSHLRVGIYHDPEISCAAPVECSVEVDNVQVMEPSP
jgi:hypothetical protein